MRGAYMLFSSYFLFCGTSSLSDVRFALPGQMALWCVDYWSCAFSRGTYECMHACMVDGCFGGASVYVGLTWGGGDGWP